ncbi:MAG: S41 family peptidase [Chloroflexota bacterium]|nr:S41 family peptidase [Chloroflexota bacterium]
MQLLRTLSIAGLVLATIALIFLAGFGTHALITGSGRDPLSVASVGFAETQADLQDTDFDVFWEAWHILQRDFFGDQPDTQHRTYGAIQGLAQEYEDPYTYFIEPQPRQREREELSGEFGGIGAWVTRDESGNIRLDPMPDRPADRAGIEKEDILVSVDDTTIQPDMTADDVVALIRGPVGEQVSLQIRRGDEPALLTMAIARERLETPSVEWRMLEEVPQVGYVAISLFSDRTANELDQALTELRDQEARHLIVDLRNNSGGLLQASVDVASRFLKDGVVLFEHHSDGSEQTFRVSGGNKAPNWPMAILVDGATASAAEIVAGALQDRARAKLIGEKTFGKGSVQLVHDLSDGSSIHVTVARWLTPNGHEINEIGLTPDLEVSHEDERDAPLEEAIKHLLNQQG